MIGKLSSEEIEDLLHRNVVGRIGCSDSHRSYVVPVNYLYDGKQIICHSQVGLKIRMMRKNPLVCFEVDEITSFKNWKSVIAWGIYTEITDEVERYRAMEAFVNRMMYLKISSTAIIHEKSNSAHSHHRDLDRSVIYRILLEEKNGRYENDEA